MSRMTVVLGAAIVTSILLAQSASQPVDYSSYTHYMRLTGLRAGNHDIKGMNEYYFQVGLETRLKTKEEIKLDDEKRKKLKTDLGEIWQISLTSLSHWKVSEKEIEQMKFPIKGDDVRDLVARTMQDFQVAESEVAVMVQLTLLEKNKKYFVLKDDVKIGDVFYFPIPMEPGKPSAQNQELTISDNKGLLATLKVTFDTAK